MSSIVLKSVEFYKNMSKTQLIKSIYFSCRMNYTFRFKSFIEHLVGLFRFTITLLNGLLLIIGIKMWNNRSKNLTQILKKYSSLCLTLNISKPTLMKNITF